MRGIQGCVRDGAALAMAAPIIILGSGLAGITVLRELRKLDQTTPVMLVAADDAAFYSKPSLSNALAAGKTAAQLMLTPAAELSRQLNAEFLPATRVESLLPAEHSLLTSRGRITYARLVLAVGAHPIRVPLAGNAAGEVLSVNSLSDYARFREKLEGARHVAILGGGLIGCEFANDLASAGIQSTIYDRSPHALGRLLPERSAAFFGDRMQATGVTFHFGATLSSVVRTGDRLRLTDDRGQLLDADLVLSAIGLKPAIELAEAAGLAVNRGIVVDRLLASSAPDVYALGDCAEVQGLVLPFVLPIMHCARALAKTLAGEATAVRYPAMPVAVKTPACPTVVCPPPAGVEGSWQESVSASGARAVFSNAVGEIQGFALLGDSVQEKQALAAGMPDWL